MWKEEGCSVIFVAISQLNPTDYGLQMYFIRPRLYIYCNTIGWYHNDSHLNWKKPSIQHSLGKKQPVPFCRYHDYSFLLQCNYCSSYLLLLRSLKTIMYCWEVHIISFRGTTCVITFNVDETSKKYFVNIATEFFSFTLHEADVSSGKPPRWCWLCDMDKLLIVSCSLFFVADIFAMASILNPMWIISRDSDFPDKMQLGLVSQCVTVFGRDTVCSSPTLSSEWIMTLIFIICAIICLTATCCLLLLSERKAKALYYARLFGFIAMICMCLAAIIFPIGFYIDEIGGKPYRLPGSVRVGSSYVIFSLAIVLTVISELFAEKVCQPIFWWIL